MELISVEVRGTRRLRLTFNASVGSGAFASTSYYAVASNDGQGASPNVKAVLMVQGLPATVEIVVSADIVSGGSYTVTAIGVPALSGNPSTILSTVLFVNGRSPTQTNVEPSTQDATVFFYGRDLTHDGNDFLESSAGDLLTTEGTANVVAALNRRVGGTFLPYDPSYGLDIRESVDSPAPTATSLKGDIIQQLSSDPRVKSVDVQLSQSNNQTNFVATPTLTGNEPVASISVTT